MKNFLVIGNPIEHSLSPKLHNYWIKKHNINAIYEKKKLNDKELKNFFINLKEKKIDGVNVTVPFKKKVIPFLNKLTKESEITQSVNTIYFQDDIIIGHNTDVSGFELGIKNFNYDIKNKSVFILGAGGVVSSLIFSLKKLKVSKIIISNRTKEKAHNLKKLFKEVIVVDWGEIPDFDMIINATSLGLKKNDLLDLNFSKIGKNKFFYDVIYNPKQTNFLKTGSELGNKTENGKLMFIYQASAAFKIWHKIEPKIDEEVIKLLD
tara:strand:- start:7 stop:798 length:792 start_codon:yes stop_codon:yes gene_type:complete